jgi:hypothetical protein
MVQVPDLTYIVTSSEGCISYGVEFTIYVADALSFHPEAEALSALFVYRLVTRIHT